MDQEVMLENYMSREGVWSVHLVRMGGPVDRDGWLGRLPSFAAGTVEARRWVEDGLGVHHLHLVGQIQDVIEMRWPDGASEKAAFWWAREVGLREAARQAAEAFWFKVGVRPVVALVRQAVERQVVCKAETVSMGLAEVYLERAYWAPLGYVVVKALTPAPLPGGEGCRMEELAG